MSWSWCLHDIEITGNPIHSTKWGPIFSIGLHSLMMNKTLPAWTTCQNTLGSIGWAYCIYYLVHRSIGKWNLWVSYPLHLTYQQVLLNLVFLEFEGVWTWPRGKIRQRTLVMGHTTQLTFVHCYDNHIQKLPGLSALLQTIPIDSVQLLGLASPTFVALVLMQIQLMFLHKECYYYLLEPLCPTV